MKAIDSRPGDSNSNTEEIPEEIKEIIDLKEQVRNRIRGIRYTLPLDIHEEHSRAITENVLHSPEFRDANVICCYVDKKSTREVSTRQILEKVLENDGKVLIVPITRTKEFKLDLSIIKSIDILVPGTFGVQEPSLEILVEPSFVDMIIVPCLAVDHRGNRLGYGKGYYDRLLATIPDDIPICALAFEHQTSFDVPTTAHDIPVNMFVTERGVTRIGNRE
ncbi:5-formyltetrahydrofolate cyclo-ligase [Candidatus Bathyarchaeota archaeon]|nr:5-formyltetrahydrofolate cyclo-ligase [Candidatus Bathyarchaeota archaeon]